MSTIKGNVAQDRFYSTLGRALKNAGYNENTAGRILASVLAEGTRMIKRNFVYNPATKLGVIWGSTTGGAVKLPFAINNAQQVTGVALDNGDSIGISQITPTLLQPLKRGLWLILFGADDAIINHFAPMIATAMGNQMLSDTIESVRGNTQLVQTVDDPAYVHSGPMDVTKADIALPEKNGSIVHYDELPFTDTPPTV